MSLFGHATTVETFNFTGSVQTWTVPSGVIRVHVRIYGAGSSSGEGGYVEGDIVVSPGEDYYIYVGEEAQDADAADRAWPDGGLGKSATSGDTASHPSVTVIGEGGAGWTGIRGPDTDDRSNTIVVAGGAAGFGRGEDVSINWDRSRGGKGGADTGEASDEVNGPDETFAASAPGGDQTDTGNYQGQDAVVDTDSHSDSGTVALASGAGGAGWDGGDSGEADAKSDDDGSANHEGGAVSGGGGGSNYDDGLNDVTSNERGTGNQGHGKVELEYATP